MTYLLTCLRCARLSGVRKPLPMPFESQEGRGKWAAEHKAATGHDEWFVVDK